MTGKVRLRALASTSPGNHCRTSSAHSARDNPGPPGTSPAASAGARHLRPALRPGPDDTEIPNTGIARTNHLGDPGTGRGRRAPPDPEPSTRLLLDHQREPQAGLGNRTTRAAVQALGQLTRRAVKPRHAHP